MVKLPGHPTTHGHHINPYTCGSRNHHACTGFSGGHDAYTCGCCCHDPEVYPDDLSTEDRVTVERMRAMRVGRQ